MSEENKWPELEWRGDGQRRAITCGTLLSLINESKGRPKGHGIDVSILLDELRRIADKYSAAKDPALRDKVIKGDLLFVSNKEVMETLTGLIDVAGVVELCGSDDEPRLRLTDKGAERLEAVYIAACADARYKHIDMKDPLLEWNPVLETDGPPKIVFTGDDEAIVDPEEAITVVGDDESHLPLKRKSRKKPSYRQWMSQVAFSPDLYAHAVTKSPADMLTPDTGPGSVILTTADARYALWRAKCNALDITPFCKTVLGGGPESIWVGKPLNPWSVHEEVESFFASARSGFTHDTVKLSSRAWEMFDADETSDSEYAELKAEMDRAATDRDTVVDEETSSEWIEERKAIGEVKKARRTVIKTTAETLMDSLRGSGLPVPGSVADGRMLSDSVGVPGALPRVRCTYTIRKSGRQCGNWAVGGGVRCDSHGGTWLEPEETKSLLRAGQTKIFAASAAAIDTVLDLMQHSSQDPVRLKAAEMILNRSGLHEKQEITISDGSDGKAVTDPGQIVRERLARLAGFEKQAEIDAARKEEMTMDAEIVEVDDAADVVEGEVAEEEGETA